mmetsp:Transcript_3920/g.7097  ORF Transcript_3920/g.7097 Transcript_3920/m.7097 type:complete len:170 (+) Transcript_3920:113-622(+)
MCVDAGLICASWNTFDPRLDPRVDATNNPCTVNNFENWAAPEIDSDGPVSDVFGSFSGYFWFHHSSADTMERVDATQLNQNVAALATWSYAIAQLPELLPRNAAAPAVATESDGSEASWVVPVFGLCSAMFLGAVGIWWCSSAKASSASSKDYSRRGNRLMRSDDSANL